MIRARKGRPRNRDFFGAKSTQTGAAGRGAISVFNRQVNRASRIKRDDPPIRPPFLHGLALALAHRCGLSGRSVECRGGRRIVSAVSGNAEHENAPDSGQRDQHGGPLAGPAYLGCGLPRRHSQKSQGRDSDGGRRPDWRNRRSDCAAQHSADDVPAPRAVAACWWPP